MPIVITTLLCGVWPKFVVAETSSRDYGVVMRKRIADWLEKMSVGMFIGGMLNPATAVPQWLCFSFGTAFFAASLLIAWKEARQ